MGKFFACSDLHGMYDLYEQIKNFLKPDDCVFFLGDAGDRGPEGWKTITAIYNDPQFKYLKGNHEDMLVKAMRENIKFEYGIGSAYSLLCYNGGQSTFEEWLALPDKERFEWHKKLKELPVHEVYVNSSNVVINLCHAGYTYNHLENMPDEEDLIWDREHIKNPQIWKPENTEVVVVHGHTPIQHLNVNEYEPGALWYCNECKCCIDNGSFYSGNTCLLDLDTFDEHVFSTNKFKKLF